MFLYGWVTSHSVECNMFMNEIGHLETEKWFDEHGNLCNRAWYIIEGNKNADLCINSRPHQVISESTFPKEYSNLHEREAAQKLYTGYGKLVHFFGYF